MTPFTQQEVARIRENFRKLLDEYGLTGKAVDGSYHGEDASGISINKHVRLVGRPRG